VLEDKPIRLKGVQVGVCGCGRMFFQGVWWDDVVEVFRRVVSKCLVVPEGAKGGDVSVGDVEPDKKLEGSFSVGGVYDGESFRVDLIGEADVKSKTCPDCGRKTGGYFEAVLQFRGIDEDFGVDENYVLKAEAVRGGVDYYLTSLHHAKKVVEKFRKKGYGIVESSKICGIREGKTIYRLYYSIKRPKVSAGDFIELDDEVYHVLDAGKRIRLLNLSTRAKKNLSAQAAGKARICARSGDVFGAVVSSVRPGEVEVLSLSSYKTFRIPVKEKLRHGEEVEVVEVGGKAYLV